MIEGGANRTSVVRREVAIQAMQKLYGNRIDMQSLYQFGSNRPIPRVRNGQPNPEYKIAQEIAGTYLPEGDDLTEFGLNVASARQAGYEILNGLEVEATEFPGVARAIWLTKDGAPVLAVVQPAERGNGFMDGLSALQSILESDNTSLERYQPVLVTNGQYRPKDELQAAKWAQEQQVTFAGEPIALGDEPGFRVVHNNQELLTGDRAPMVYVNEAVVLDRLRA